MNRITNAFLLMLNLVAIVALIAINCIPFIPPSSVLSIISIANLAFPFFLVLNVFFVIIWAFRLKWYFLLSVIFILFSIPNLHNLYSFSPEKKAEKKEGSISVLTYNIHYFNFFEKEQGTKTGNSILDYLANCDADIICLQEFCYSDYNDFSLKQIQQHLKKYPYSYIEILYKDRYLSKGVATFSKHKIINREKIDILSAYHTCIASDVLVKGDTVKIINCYLESNRLTEKEKKIYRIEDEKEKITSLAKRIQNKLNFASRKRGDQAKIIAKYAQKSTIPLVVCGDLNDVPTSYTYRTIKDTMTDSFTELSKGFGNTFHEKIYAFRIDYIFTGKRINPLAYETSKFSSSDHYPIRLNFEITE